MTSCFLKLYTPARVCEIIIRNWSAGQPVTPSAYKAFVYYSGIVCRSPSPSMGEVRWGLLASFYGSFTLPHRYHYGTFEYY